MRKFWKVVIGGIDQKILTLVLVTLLLVAAAFYITLSVQFRTVENLIGETEEAQKVSVAETSGITMGLVVENTLTRTANLTAGIANRLFVNLMEKLDILEIYLSHVIEIPDDYVSIDYNPPVPENEGKAETQLVLAEGVNMKSPAVRAKLKDLKDVGQLLGTLCSINKDTEFYIGTPEGLFIIADYNSAGKILEDGSIITFDCRERQWYKGAVETGKPFIADIQRDFFTDKLEFVMSVPIYREGELFCVIGGSMFVSSFSEFSGERTTENMFTVVLNKKGYPVLAPEAQNVFSTEPGCGILEKREARTSELADYVERIFEGKGENCVTLTVDGVEYMVSASVIESAGWVVLSMITEELTRFQSTVLTESLNSISEDAARQYSQNLRKAQYRSLIIFAAIMVLGSAIALMNSRRIVKPLTRITERISEAKSEGFRFEMEPDYETGDEVEVLARSFSELSRRMDGYIEEIKAVTAEKEHISAELGVAKRIQSDMLPSKFPPYPGRKEFDVYAAMKPAKEVGGDFYDIFLIDKNHLALVIADVSGKGIPAALFMVVAKTLIKNRAQMGGSPARILKYANEQLDENNQTGMFVTVWLAIIDLRTGEGVAANAGHEHPVLKRKDGVAELVKYKHSPIVGMIEDAQYEEHSFKLEKGDLLFVYTDGVPEATDKDEKQFGTDRMLQILNAIPQNIEISDVLEKVYEGIERFTLGSEQFDDITMLAFRYLGDGK